MTKVISFKVITDDFEIVKTAVLLGRCKDLKLTFSIWRMKFFYKMKYEYQCEKRRSQTMEMSLR